jgi:hypothetical protein
MRPIVREVWLVGYVVDSKWWGERCVWSDSSCELVLVLVWSRGCPVGV